LFSGNCSLRTRVCCQLAINVAATTAANPNPNQITGEVFLLPIAFILAHCHICLIRLALYLIKSDCMLRFLFVDENVFYGNTINPSAFSFSSATNPKPFLSSAIASYNAATNSCPKELINPAGMPEIWSWAVWFEWDLFNKTICCILLFLIKLSCVRV